MDLGISGRAAIVAASSKGLGLAVAHALAAEGANIAMCSRDAAGLSAAAASIAKHGTQVFHRALDVTDGEAVSSFVADTAARFGRLDICVTNAGGPPSKGFLDISVDEWRRAIDLNLMSTVYFAREVIPHMQRARWGRLVTITSVSIKQPIDGLMLSNAVRAGATGLAKTLANEFGKDNILVNNICPGFTLTDRLASSAKRFRKRAGSPWSKRTPCGHRTSPWDASDVPRNSPRPSRFSAPNKPAM